MKALVTADAVGGVWQYSVDLARGLSALGTETVLAVLGPRPSDDQRKAALSVDGLRLVETDLPLDWLAKKPEDIATAGRSLAELAATCGVDVVQVNAAALLAEVQFDRPVAAVAHSCLATWWRATKGTQPDGDFRWRSALTRAGLAAADRVVAPTSAFARATMVVHGLETLPTTVHNGRSPLSVAPQPCHDFAFTAGRLWDKGKNAATLDRAAERLQFPLYAAGPVRGPGGDTIELSYASALGVLPDVEVARWMAARPVFVSAAVYEPFGLAVLEAAAAGCPLVLSDIPTFRELWHDVAAFVDPMDAAGFAEMTALIIGDQSARAEMGRKARQRAAQFSVGAMASKMQAVYESLLHPTGRTRTAQVAA